MKCFSCASRKYVDESSSAKRRDSELNKQLKDWHKDEEKVVKLLLLGIGESGKSTITKQMRIIHIDGFTESERKTYIPDIRRNIRDAILILLGAMSNLNVPLGNEELAEARDYILQESSKDDFDYPQIFYDHVHDLWEDKGVAECYSRSNEYQLFDSAKYFLDRLYRICEEDYLPLDQDILRCRVITSSILKIDFVAKDAKTDVHFSVYDVGGQQGERRKWLQVFDMTNAVMFVVDCSCFDQTLREDTNRNRLLEAMETFEQVWNNRWLRNVPIMLFLNKIDLLEEKINQGRSLNDLLGSMDEKHPYYDVLSAFKTFKEVRDSERREFIEAFPRSDVSKLLRSGRKKSSVLPQSPTDTLREDLGEEIIRTAVFIKRVFTHLVQYPVKSTNTSKWHEHHSCELFFTCAVDTKTIKKVLEGCRTFIIRRVLNSVFGWRV